MAGRVLTSGAGLLNFPYSKIEHTGIQAIHLKDEAIHH
jgi:hypothetical protein